MKFIALVFSVVLFTCTHAHSRPVLLEIQGIRHSCLPIGSGDPTVSTSNCAKQESITLCASALSTQTAECALQAYRAPFSKSEAVTLCSGTATTRTAECAIQAVRGPYSKKEAIRLCQGSYPTGLKSKKIKISKESAEEMVIQANLKAFNAGEYKE